jgi:citrate synthase
MMHRTICNLDSMNQSELLNARDAAARLGVKLDTLYAYVSRGQLRSIGVPGSRERHYRVQDIEAFRAARGSSRATTHQGVEAAMPAIDSAISLIEGGRLYYRGQDAVRLSDSATLEAVAALLWDTHLDPGAGSGHAGGKLSASGAGPHDLIARCQSRLATMAAESPPILELARPALAGAGQSILREMVGCLIEARAKPLPAHRQLAHHWRLDETGGELVRRCLVLIADHELNTSTLTARCVASTGASLAAVVSAALGALSGPRHGGAASRVEAMFHAEGEGGDPVMAMAARLARGEQLPGIGQPLYPHGDPRAVAILYALSLTVPHARRLVVHRPNVDFALAAVTTALGLPVGAALGLFVVGRTVGWIAHAIEQYDSDVLIRPRARYTGPRPA